MKIDGQGNITLNIQDVVEALDQESRNEIIHAFAWERVIKTKLEDIVLNEYANRHFNDDLWELRLAYLTSDDSESRVRDVVGKLMRSAANKDREITRWRNAYWKLFHAFPAGVERPSMPEMEFGKAPSEEEIDRALKKAVK